MGRKWIEKMIKIARVSFRSKDAPEKMLATVIRNKFKEDDLTKDVICTVEEAEGWFSLLGIYVEDFGNLTAVMIASKIAKILDIANSAMRDLEISYVVKIEKQ